MATSTLQYINKLKNFGGVPFGNARLQQFTLITAAGISVNASGAANTDQATALQIADVVRLGIIPSGTTLFDIQAIISAAFSATTTASVGFAYVDGVDVAAVPQNAAYFTAALALNATGVSRKTSVTAPVTIPKDAYLTLTNQVAAQAGAGQVDIVLIGIGTGA